MVNIFNTSFPFYTIMILISFILNIFIIMKIYKKYNFNKNEIICILLYENVGIVLGAKIYTFIQNYTFLNGKFNFVTLGFSSYGALIGVILFLILFCFQFKKSLSNMFYMSITPIPLMYAIGKIGCFLSGCCYGIEYDGPCYIMYKYSENISKYLKIFPVQLIESVCFILIFVYILIYTNKRTMNIGFLGFIFIACGLIKFILDFFRMSHIGTIISLNQGISLFFILAGTILYSKYKKTVPI